MIGHGSSHEELLIQLARASANEDPITEWHLTTEEYYSLKSAPRALSYFGYNQKGHCETIYGLPYKVIKNAQTS